MTVVDVRSYSRISGRTSALTDSVSPGAFRRTISAMRASCRVRVRMDQAHRERLDLLREQTVEHPLDLPRIQRFQHVALRVDALVDLRAQIALDEGDRLFLGEVVELRHPDAPDLED